MTTVLFLGGGFDPVHRGHLFMARQVYDAWLPDHFLFIPSALNPLKGRRALAGPRHRLRMLELALKDTPFEIDHWELEQEGASFTWNTLRHLQDRFGADARFSMLIGEAQLEFLLLPRADDGESAPLPRFCHRLQAPRVEVSSTQVRELIAAGGDAAELLPAAVWEYIQAEGLYRKPDVQAAADTDGVETA